MNLSPSTDGSEKRAFRNLKQTPLGPLPVDWEVKTLGEIATISSGGTPSRKIANFWNGDIPWVTTSEIDFYEIKSAKESITADGLKFSSAKLFPAGTILVALYGQGKTRGKVGLLGIEATTNQACAAIVLKSDVITNFVFHSLANRYQEIRNLSNSGGQENLSGAIVKSLLIPLPPLSEQRAIAGALGDIDAWIGAQEALIAKKRDLKTATMAQLLTGQIRLAGFDGDWQTQTFAEVVSHGSGDSTLIKGKLKSVASPNLFPAYSASGQDVWRSSYEHEGEAIIISAVGSRCGKAFLASGKWSAIANTHIVRPISSKADLRFIYLYLNDENFWTKGGSGQPFVLFRQSFSQSLRLPALDEQIAVAEILSGLDEELAALEAQLDKTRQLKAATMTALLSGQRRLV